MEMDRCDPRLRLVLPTGSLEKPVIDLFELAGLPIIREEGSYYGMIDDPRIQGVLFVRPQYIPILIQHNQFDLGITGYDWLVEQSWGDALAPDPRIIILAELSFGRKKLGRTKIVMAVEANDEITDPKQIPPGTEIITEYFRITNHFLLSAGIAEFRLIPSYGTTEALVPLVARILVDLTETGKKLRLHNKRIIAEIIESYTALVTSQVCFHGSEKIGIPAKKEPLEDIRTLLLGAFEAKTKVMLKMNVPQDKLDAVLRLLPALQAPTVSPLAIHGYYAVESVVPRRDLPILIPKLKNAGATGIVELPIAKIIP
jgi:ATP phosphoribosyltransferase